MAGDELGVGLGAGLVVGLGVGVGVALGEELGEGFGEVVGCGVGACVDGLAVGVLAAPWPPPAAVVSGVQATSARTPVARAPANRRAPARRSGRVGVTCVMSGLGTPGL
jgi:hypothetical protein